MNGDLISRSALLSKMTDRTFRSELHEYRHYQNIVKMMPTAYNVDKVVEQLEDAKYEDELYPCNLAVEIEEAKRIVKSGGIE